jgi:hypothetical protein
VIGFFSQLVFGFPSLCRHVIKLIYEWNSQGNVCHVLVSFNQITVCLSNVTLMSSYIINVHVCDLNAFEINLPCNILDLYACPSINNLGNNQVVFSLNNLVHFLHPSLNSSRVFVIAFNHNSGKLLSSSLIIFCVYVIYIRNKTVSTCLINLQLLHVSVLCMDGSLSFLFFPDFQNTFVPCWATFNFPLVPFSLQDDIFNTSFNFLASLYYYSMHFLYFVALFGCQLIRRPCTLILNLSFVKVCPNTRFQHFPLHFCDILSLHNPLRVFTLILARRLYKFHLSSALPHTMNRLYFCSSYHASVEFILSTCLNEMSRFINSFLEHSCLSFNGIDTGYIYHYVNRIWLSLNLSDNLHKSHVIHMSLLVYSYIPSLITICLGIEYYIIISVMNAGLVYFYNAISIMTLSLIYEASQAIIRSSHLLLIFQIKVHYYIYTNMLALLITDCVGVNSIILQWL